MAILVSPGVHVSEVDLTTSTPAVSTSTGAIAGSFKWGPANTAVLISSEVQLANTFGAPDGNTANAFFTAASFLAYSNSLYVARANSAGSNNATSNGTGELIKNEHDYFVGSVYNSLAGQTGNPFTARYPGAMGNSLSVYVWANAAVWTANTSNTADPLYPYASLFDYAPGTSPSVLSKTGYACNDELHILVVDTYGAFSGTANTILEKYQSISRLADATAPDGSNNYYKNVLFNKSSYVYWTGVPSSNVVHWGANTAVVNSNSFFTSDASPNVASLSAGADGHASDGDLSYAYNVFADKEAIDISLLMGADSDATVSQQVVQIATDRIDSVAFVSPPLANTLGTGGDSSGPAQQIVNYFQGLNAYSSYAVADSGWKYMYDKYNDVYRWVPLNGDIAGLCAYTDNVKDPWWSPAGLQRGSIKNVIKLAFNPNQASRDLLYKNGVNPVVSFPGQGTLLYGDKTMQNRPSAFDRINVRRLFIVLEKTISQAAQSSLFEINDEFTQSQFVALVDPFLRTVQGRRGIYAYKIVCDDSNNTPAVVDANQFVGDIYIQPARSINFIQLNFVATRTGVNFSEVVGQF